MASPTFIVIVQVIGCPAGDADRVGAVIDLDMAGARADAIEVRRGARVEARFGRATPLANPCAAVSP